MKAKLVKHESGYILYDEDNITIGAEPNVLSSDVFSKLSIKNCQAIEHGYDLDELADNYGFRVPYDGTKDFYDLDAIKHYKAGFQKALELMKHRLSEETEWDVEVEMELDVDTSKLFGAIYGQKSKLDADGCLIFKRI